MTRQTWIVATIAILAFACLLHNNSAEKRVLSAAEKVQADAARSEIAQVIERNLIKFFALVAASGETGKNRGPYQRQEGEEQEDEEDPDSSEAAEATEPTEAPETTTLEPTLDPTFFPQVAEILGGVFSGQLNVPGVVDKTFGLMPGTLKTQVEGLFKLLTGADYPTKPPSSTTTEAAEEPPADEASTEGVKIITETSTQAETTAAPPTTAESTTPPPPTPPPTTTTESYKAKLRNRYTVNRRRNRNSSSTMSPDSLGPVVLLQQDEDDTLFRLEKKIVAAAVDAEPFIRDADPEIYRRQVRGIFSNLNSQVNFTEIVKILPDLFKGARQAFLLLENLGVIDGDTELSEIADIFE